MALRSGAGLVLIVCLSAALGACHKKAPPTPALAPADQTYSIRGVIDRLPAGKFAMQIHHEAIPAFINRRGETVGMPEMIMEFPSFAPGVNTSDLKEGDAIEFTFEVRWNSDPRSLVTKVRKLTESERPQLMKVTDPNAALTPDKK